MKQDVLDRLLPKFTVGDGCWEWQAGTCQDYGMFWLDGQTLRAHRVVYELVVGPIPDGLQLDHLCRNRRCVNPDHLEPVTMKENLRRGLESGVGSGARERAKTHCAKGHPFNDENTAIYDGVRKCRACHREWARKGRERRRSAA